MAGRANQEVSIASQYNTHRFVLKVFNRIVTCVKYQGLESWLE